ncbi:Extracellular serine protease precursor [compost metagenome]
MPSQGGKMGRMYGKLSGTSMAAPFVSGEAALIIAQHPTYTVEQVRNRIRTATDEKGAAGRDSKYGYGRMNLAKALD